MNYKNKSNNIVIFTENYPYDKGEQFLTNDYFHLAKKFNDFIIITNSNGKNQRKRHKLPPNLKIWKLNEVKSNKLNLIKNFKSTFLCLYYEIIINKRRIYFLKNLKKFLSILSECLEIENELFKLIKSNQLENAVFHSTWMNKYALVLSIAVTKKHINSFTFRVHGYDLYNNRSEGGYIPFEILNYAKANKIILNSKFSLNYKLKNTLFKNKLNYNYFSIDNTKFNPFDENSFRIVSCSSLIPLKRVHLIYNALKHIDFKMEWVHFGDGIEKSKLDLSLLPKNITVNLMGNVVNESIHEFYRKNSVNLFVHTSETEGLGFAILEALSFGIPCLVTNSGGVRDLINDKNGKLLPLDISEIEIAKEIKLFKYSEKNSLDFRFKIKNEFNKKYNDQKIIDKSYKLMVE